MCKEAVQRELLINESKIRGSIDIQRTHFLQHQLTWIQSKFKFDFQTSTQMNVEHGLTILIALFAR